MKKFARIFPLALVFMLLMASGGTHRTFAHSTVRSLLGTFVAAGSGTETSLSPPNCQNTGTRDCTVQMTGTVSGFPVVKGSYTTTLTIHWGSATSNGSGGFCAPADGPTTLTATNGDQLTLQNTGTVCEIGPTGLTVPHRYTGTYTITGGTGHFLNATGNGQVIGFDDGQGHAYFVAWGTISCQLVS